MDRQIKGAVMNIKHIRTYLMVCSLVVVLQPLQGFAQQNSDAARTSPQRTPTERDGQHDFDFEIGTWKTHLSRLLHPLTGSTTWVEFEGTSDVGKVLDDRANMGEIEVDGPAGHIEVLTMRRYDPQSQQWRLSWVNTDDGTLGQAMIGEFKNGRGEFFGQESLSGHAISVRFVFLDVTPHSFRFEQAFSDDGGKTWEVNWIATFTRVNDEFDKAH